MQIILWILVAVLVFLGVAGTVIPSLPGAPLVFLGLLLAAWMDGFERVGLVTLLVLGGFTVVSVAMDYLATIIGTRRMGGSRSAIIGAFVGTVLGLFFGLPGIFLGPFVGAVGGELYARKGIKNAARAGLGTWLGFVFGTALKIAIVFTMIGVFAVVFFLS